MSEWMIIVLAVVSGGLGLLDALFVSRERLYAPSAELHFFSPTVYPLNLNDGRTGRTNSSPADRQPKRGTRKRTQKYK